MSIWEGKGPHSGPKIWSHEWGVSPYLRLIYGPNTGPNYGAKTSFGGLRGALPHYLRRKNGTHGKQHIEQSSLAPLCKAAKKLKKKKGKRRRYEREKKERTMVRDVDVFGAWLFWVFMLLLMACAFGSDIIGCVMLVVYFGGIITFCLGAIASIGYAVLN